MDQPFITCLIYGKSLQNHRSVSSCSLDGIFGNSARATVSFAIFNMEFALKIIPEGRLGL